MRINQLNPTKYFNPPRATKRNNTQNTSANAGVAVTTGNTVSNNINTVSNIAQKYDVKNISPREMINMSQELYESGIISFKTYAFMSFQIEVLDPNYNNTTGGFTNTIAKPDQPRDFLEEWQDRLQKQKGSGLSAEIIKNTKDVVAVLENLNLLRGGKR